MQPDDELCLCFHVTKRKVVNFLRVERPQRPGQLSECFGAGTGCGWCRPFLKRLFDEAVAARTAANPCGHPAGSEQPVSPVEEPSAADYAKLRAAYVKSGGGTPPPGATPIE
jgi:bacterioferritin-associated ferredoxin